ncbi:DUF2207 domain-containing protein [Hoeflea sp. YIM 152468]|uniref:DUF2207 domain-containing protein n=1 Tax=Hoeflea sp. YIM 152468 TaxID=3031759 RepID=UPI0023D9C8D5|nr:DUF2207 domain-containing protein [Hoeflea sp. YIM 152468]MDF1606614.1 DUF2207 domain-containing protein [Hoeflea sp. YIM 152468]
MRHWLFAILICLAASAPQAATAREEIRSFAAEIEVRTDASLDVTETITVNAEGNEIRRGIFRDIPMRALDDWGLWAENGFDLIEVLHNGQPATYVTEWLGRFVRIRIGDAETLISRGQHTYTIRYVTTGQLRFFDGYDELYWNVTGNFWSFPILAADATVTLPEGARAEQLAAYTGGFGDQGEDYAASGEGRSEVRFDLTRPLGPQQGMTIAVGFTKGAVTPDAGGAGMWTSNAGIFLLILGWLGVPVYYLYAWNRVGRDPPSPPVIPLFYPPENLSPAALSYAHFNRFRTGKKGVGLPFIAALLSLGVKGFLRIDETPGGTVTLRRGEAADKKARQPLPGGENALFSRLLTSRAEMVLDKHNGPALQSAVAGLRKAITSEYEGRFYRANIGWYIPGVVLGIATFIIGLILQDPPDDGLLYLIPILMTSLFGGGLWIAGRSLWNKPGGGWINRIGSAGLALLGGVVFLVGVLVVLVPGDVPVYQIAGALLISGIAIMILMLFLLGAPTEKGAKVLADIKGFKLYLETAETNRLNLRDAPEMTEKLFERFLPYAAGLGVEKPWSEAWAAQLARIAPDRERDYQPHWYQGNSWSPGNIGAAAASSVAAVSAAMAASMPQPKSSSGSSGGGSSGGGGGGGGGGGW